MISGKFCQAYYKNILSYIRHNALCESRSWPTRIATKDARRLSRCLRTKACSLTTHRRNEGEALWAKRMSSAYTVPEIEHVNREIFK